MKSRFSRLLFMSCLLAACGAPALLAQEKPVVRTVTPAPANNSRIYAIPGRTEPLESALVFTRATGIVRERKFDIGDKVKAGDVLAIIDVPEVDRAIESARASVEQALVRAKNARTSSDRASSLLESRAISIEESDQRVATAGELEASVRVAQAELARLEEQKKFATVRAPFDAVISARNFDRGDRMRGDSSTAEGWLYRLVRLDELRFTVNATPDLALRLDAAKPATVRFREFPGRVFSATVARSSQVFDPASGTMRVELLLPNENFLLPAGLTGTASFDVAPGEHVFLVPTNTLIVRDGQTQVATVREGKVAFVEVMPGRNLGVTVEVSSAGIAADTPIIINPNGLLRAGDAVENAPLVAGK